MAQIFYNTLTEGNRNIYALLLFVLNSITTLFSISLFGISIYIFFYFTTTAHLLGEDFSFGTFSVIYLLVSAFVTLQQSGLCYALNYSRRSANRRTLMEWGVNDWIVYSYILTTFIALPAVILYTNWFFSQISIGFVNGMKDKLQKYPTDRAERVVFNNLQFEYQCCGAKDYLDWRDVFESDDNSGLTVPFSCCKIQINGFCYNKDVEKVVHRNTINRKGCAKIFYEYIAVRVYYADGLWILINFAHLVSLIFFQYWKSSAESAIKSGRTKGKSDGWLFIPFLGTYTQIVKDFKTQQNDRKERKALIPKTGVGAHQTFGFDVFTDIKDPPLTPQTYLPDSPQVSPRYQLLAPELPNQMNRVCEKCGRHTFTTGKHLCFVKHPSTSLMAIINNDSDSSSDLFNEHQKNYQNKPDLSERSGKRSVKTPIGPKFQSKDWPKMINNQKISTTDEDSSLRVEALKRKYKERYFILKEIR